MERRNGLESIMERVPAHHAWRLRARHFQQQIYKVLGDRYYDEVPNHLLGKKIGFALYGPPTEARNNELTYTEDKMKIINKLENHIKKKNAQSTYLASVFICVRGRDDKRSEGSFVIFRILENGLGDENFDNHVFVDSCCRTYKSWDDYLENCKLTKCDMCAPKKGMYSSHLGRVEVSYHESPACDVTKDILTGLDVTSTVLGLAATGINIAALAMPVAAPLVWGATATILASGSYEAGRSVAKLVDRKQHDESLSLKDNESRGLWLSLATSTLGVVSVGGRAVSKARSIFKTGNAVINAESLALRVANYCSLGVSGIGILNSLITAVIKFQEGTLEIYDLLQFTSACYFFVNALISLEDARFIIETVSSGNILNIFAKRNRDVDFIKKLNDMRGSRNYQLLLQFVNSNRFMPRIDFQEVDRIAGDLLTLVNDISSGRIDWTDFSVQMVKVSRTLWSKYKNPITEAVNNILGACNEEDERLIFITPAQQEIVYSKPDIARQLCVVANNVIEHCDIEDDNGFFMKEIITLVFKFNSRFGNNFSADFLKRAQFVCDCISNEFDNLYYEYELARDIAESSSDYFDEEEFNRSYDRTIGSRWNIDTRTSFTRKAINHLKYSLEEMQTAYSELPRNNPNRAPPCFETNISKQYFYNSQAMSTDNHYWEMAKEISELDLNIANATLHWCENGVVLIRPNIRNCNVKLFAFANVEEGDSAVGVLTLFMKYSSS